MKKLSKTAFDEASKFIKEHGRKLENCIFTYRFEKPYEYEILDELKKYQNEDGGFGNALESDFRLPDSSPMATSIALQHLTKIDHKQEVLDAIKAAIGYLEEKFIRDRNGWLAVPKEVNNYPHTPWWGFTEEEGTSVIDKNWGNPSAEIIGFMYKYKIHVKKLDVDKLVEYAINYFNSQETIESFHEVYCFIGLYRFLPIELQAKIKDKLYWSVGSLVSKDSSEWKGSYVAKPLDFVSEPGNSFGISEDLINLNLDFLIDTLEEEKVITPSWGKVFYERDLEPSWNEWLGVLTLKALITLDRFNRIER
jgi:hypothetical protein